MNEDIENCKRYPNQPTIISRNKFRIIIYGALFLLTIYGFLIEPKWILIENVNLSPKPTYRLVHISDIHFNGDKSYLDDIVSRINKISPDFVCFTGDLVDEKSDLKQALDILQKINCPLFGVPGNHEYWSGVSFNAIAEAFKRAGGLWLVNQKTQFKDLEIIGMANEAYKQIESNSKHPQKRLLLSHYPEIVKQIHHEKYDLILAGHSHGGQIRLPIFGALKVPYGVDKYDKGLYTTEAGSLYVNSGLGTYGIHFRLLCRPEITIIEF